MFRVFLAVVVVATMMLAAMPQRAAATEAAPLTKAEAAHYAQLQAQAEQNQVLGLEGGMEPRTAWILVGVAVVVVTVSLLIWA
jgi:hypothetical protein